MQTATRLLLAIFLWAGLAAAASAAPAVPPAAAVGSAIADVLNAPERLPLPLERIRLALIAHYIRDQAPVYWVGTGRITPFLQRLADAADDGLNPADYPLDALIELRDTIDPADAESAALAELFFTAFYVNYATDLKIGRLTPQKVDPKNFRKLMDANRWWFTMAQCGDETFYYQPNRDNSGYDSSARMTASCVVAFIYTIPKRSLAITGRASQ